jgi:hypothetical protein
VTRKGVGEGDGEGNGVCASELIAMRGATIAVSPTAGPIFKKDRRPNSFERWFDAEVVFDFFLM